MATEDPKLDAALAALAGTATTVDDDRWARRVASQISSFAPANRRELDPLLEAPFPDGHVDGDVFDPAARADNDSQGAALAVDDGDVRGWEGSMSESSRPPNSLNLGGLTRSGPVSKEPDVGAAKGDDSGLIDLRSMSQPESEAAAAEPAVKAAEPESGRIQFAKTLPASPSAIANLPPTAPSNDKAPLAALGSTAPAPSSTMAAATSVAAGSAPVTKTPSKGRTGTWIALGGFAVAAGVAAMFVVPGLRKDSAPATEAAAQKPAPAENKADQDKGAAPPPAATAAPTASGASGEESAPAASGSAADPGNVALAPKGGPLTPGAKSMVGAKESDPKAAPATKPTASAAPTATTDPINKPSGGSLDDVLGIGKDQPQQAKKDPTSDLPDKPDSMEVRSAINAKLGAARACVKGLEESSSVTVTFGPAGTVSGVVVTSGPAKGTGAEACIKNAFSSAKVPPSKKGASGNAVLVP